jgi:hypothetical protein
VQGKILNLVDQVNRKIDENFDAINSKLANSGEQYGFIASYISNTKMIVLDLYQSLIDEISNIIENIE